jgi:lipopolysaccharide export LptBFGC system permease protein LptF
MIWIKRAVKYFVFFIVLTVSAAVFSKILEIIGINGAWPFCFLICLGIMLYGNDKVWRILNK